MLDVPEFFCNVRKIFAGILVCMARKLNEAWRKKAGANIVLRDFKQALRGMTVFHSKAFFSGPSSPKKKRL